MRQSQDKIPNRRIKVMRIIARMNVGGPAVQVSGLMRGLSATDFDHRLYSGYCAEDEADYIKEQAPDVRAIQLDGLGRKVSPRADLFVLFRLIREIRSFKPDVIHTHTAKAGVIGRIASILSFHSSKRTRYFQYLNATQEKQQEDLCRLQLTCISLVSLPHRQLRTLHSYS